MRRRLFSALSIGLFSAGCYHATFETGLPASSTIVDKPFAASFIFGLVPPADVDVSSQCKNGVSKVETQQSFLNSLVGIITIGIFTPVQITVTCASSNKMGAIPTGAQTVNVQLAATPAQVNAATHTAVLLSLAQSAPVYFTH
jgi:hypothetical protein